MLLSVSKFWCIMHGCTNTRREVAVATKFCSVAPNICKSSVCCLIQVIEMEPTISRCILSFYKNVMWHWLAAENEWPELLNTLVHRFCQNLGTTSKFFAARWLTWSNFRPEYLQILRRHCTEISRPRDLLPPTFVHPCIKHTLPRTVISAGYYPLSVTMKSVFR